MSERNPIRNLETPRKKPYSEIRRSIELIEQKLGNSPAFITAIGVHELSGQADQVLIWDEVLADGTRDSYEYSAEVRERDGVSITRALGLKVQDRVLFMQYGRHLRTGTTFSEVELLMGSRRPMHGIKALRRIHEAFPRFYAAPVAA